VFTAVWLVYTKRNTAVFTVRVHKSPVYTTLPVFTGGEKMP